jgi:hypothetical protein
MSCEFIPIQTVLPSCGLPTVVGRNCCHTNAVFIVGIFLCLPMDPDVLVLRIEGLNLPPEGSFRVQGSSARRPRAIGHAWGARTLEDRLVEGSSGTVDGMLRVRQTEDRAPVPLPVTLEGWMCLSSEFIPIVA